MIMCTISGSDYNGLTILLRSILIMMLPDINFTMIVLVRQKVFGSDHKITHW